MPKIVIIIPTYNERENTSRMIEELALIFKEINNYEMNLLYVDGNSPDGTPEVIKKKKIQYKWLHLLVENKKEGLGRAYAKGMEYAIQELKADYLMEFDGDFQHRPQDIFRMITELENGYDYIIGSRYIKGGSIPDKWGIERKFLSVFGNLVARTLLILPQIHDVTGGFKLSKVKGFLDEFDFNSLLTRSFAYKIHLLFYMVQKGAKIKEVPIQFEHRTSGESKLIKNEMQETLRVIFLLQYYNPKIRRFLKFGTVGFVGYLINAISLYLFTKFKLPSLIAWGGSTELSIISNFTLNNYWTFKTDKIKGVKNITSKFFQFNLTSIGALAIQIIVGVTVDSIIGTQYRQIVLPLTIVFLVLPYNYFMYTRVVWKKKN